MHAAQQLHGKRKAPVSISPTGVTPPAQRAHVQFQQPVFPTQQDQQEEQEFDIDGAAHAEGGYERDWQQGSGTAYQTPRRNSVPAFHAYTPYGSPPPAATDYYGAYSPDPRVHHLESQVAFLQNRLIVKDNEIAGLKQQLQTAEEKLSALEDVVHSNTARIQCAEEAQQAGTDHLLAKVLDLAKPVLATETESALSEAKALVQELTDKINDLKMSMEDVQRVAQEAAPVERTNTGFIRKGGVVFDIKNVPAACVEEDIRKALANFFGVDEVPLNMVGRMRPVFVNEDKDFSIWSFKLFAEDYLSMMEDKPSIRISTKRGEQHPTRIAYISEALSTEERNQRRIRKRIADKAKGGEYIIRWNRAIPYAIHKQTRRSYSFIFNASMTEATMNNMVYRDEDAQHPNDSA